MLTLRDCTASQLDGFIDVQSRGLVSPMTKKNSKNKNTASRGGTKLYRQIVSPFHEDSQKWPDELTTTSTTFSSRAVVAYSPKRGDAVSGSTNHNGGIVMYPNPMFAFSQLFEGAAGSGNLSDLDFNGTTVDLAPVPNLAAIQSMQGRIRCAGMACKVVYEGTELNRAGRYYAGHSQVMYTPTVIPITGTRLSAFSTWTSGNTFFKNIGPLQQDLRNVTTSRIADGVFSAHWLPTRVPGYMAVPVTTPSLNRIAGSSPATGTPTVLNNIVGFEGQETGQSALVIAIEGDLTPASSATGNTYSVELIWHWEFIPENLYASIVTLSPSPYHPMELAYVLNNIQFVQSAIVLSAAYEGAGMDTGPASRRLVTFERRPGGENVTYQSRPQGSLASAAQFGVKYGKQAVEAYLRSRSAGGRGAKPKGKQLMITL